MQRHAVIVTVTVTATVTVTVTVTVTATVTATLTVTVTVTESITVYRRGRIFSRVRVCSVCFMYMDKCIHSIVSLQTSLP